MTIRLPMKLLAALAYTVALLSASFAISYFVFEWRQEDGSGDFGPNIESVSNRVDQMDERLNSVDEAEDLWNLFNNEPAATYDAAACDQAILAYVVLVSDTLSGQISGGAQDREYERVTKLWKAAC